MRARSGSSPRRGRLQRILAFFGLADDQAPPNCLCWSVGEMAECVIDGPWFTFWGKPFGELERGQVAIVRVVRIVLHPDGQHRAFLGFARWPGKTFDARGFRKLVPHADAAEAADAAFLSTLKPSAVHPPLLIAARLQRILS